MQASSKPYFTSLALSPSPDFLLLLLDQFQKKGDPFPGFKATYLVSPGHVSPFISRNIENIFWIFSIWGTMSALSVFSDFLK